MRVLFKRQNRSSMCGALSQIQDVQLEIDLCIFEISFRNKKLQKARFYSYNKRETYITIRLLLQNYKHF